MRNQIISVNSQTDLFGRYLIQIINLQAANTYCKSLATSDGSMAAKIIPEKNLVIFENGKEVNYDTLMLAPGIGKDFDQIQGLEDALRDVNVPVFTTYDFNPDQVIFIFNSLFKNQLLKSAFHNKWK